MKRLWFYSLLPLLGLTVMAVAIIVGYVKEYFNPRYPVKSDWLAIGLTWFGIIAGTILIMTYAHGLYIFLFVFLWIIACLRAKDLLS